MTDMINVKVGEVTKQYTEGTSFIEIAKDFESSYDSPIVLVLKNGKLITNYKKDESPDTGDYSLPVNYVIAVGLAALGAIFLLCRKKKY